MKWALILAKLIFGWLCSFQYRGYNMKEDPIYSPPLPLLYQQQLAILLFAYHWPQLYHHQRQQIIYLVRKFSLTSTLLILVALTVTSTPISITPKAPFQTLHPASLLTIICQQKIVPQVLPVITFLHLTFSFLEFHLLALVLVKWHFYFYTSDKHIDQI